ncbi:PilX N-terminal domain-containing pilus assembly protein [Aestuariibacter sp. A3R04]|uniref:PilX N-terminal domain-containing pilus assembly protein n=1 Tax=Aestuariibacter sp. A3R04 TaxID=2841571 RepID=UPI001C082C5B|nr:PilX N-terminal domain-containing pilus assembly protein [Aestuariibacter sp. A3R04]MBU3021860.1 pilus assembly protein PilZ [Aestuariibacter sp. A3R04]
MKAVNQVNHQQGMVLVLALLILLSLTILGVSAVSSSLSQNKMAMSMQRSGMAFDAAEAALAGVFFEAEDKIVLTDNTKKDPLTEARQGLQFDPDNDAMSCFDNGWTARSVTSTGLSAGTEHKNSGNYQTDMRTQSWSRTAFIREQACRGSSNVIGGSNVNCHVFVVRGCGKVSERSTVVANTVTAAVMAPASQ